MIASNLCAGLAQKGHEVKALGLHYAGNEHNFPFSILPCPDIRAVTAMFHNFCVALWKPDVVIVALDIPQQRFFLRTFQQYGVPYIGITPLESGPLCMTWAMICMQMKACFFISQHGADEAKKKGVPAEHLQIGIDIASWRLPEAEERKAIRDVLGVEDDTFVILTVADNQERKNPARALEIVAAFGEKYPKFKYIMVTREHCPVGMEIRDFAADLGINDRLDIYERGISFKQLWSLYAAADAFLLASKAEGLGVPFLEAMAVGVPVVGTRTGALVEHVEQGGGWLIEPDYDFTDMFGNGKRYFANVQSGMECLEKVYEGGVDIEAAVKKARAYVESRTWEIPILQLDETIRRIVDDEKAQKELQHAAAV